MIRTSPKIVSGEVFYSSMLVLLADASALLASVSYHPGERDGAAPELCVITSLKGQGHTIDPFLSKRSSKRIAVTI